MAETKKLDYSASADNLRNDPKLGIMLLKLHERQGALVAIKEMAQSHIPQAVRDGILATEAEIANLEKSIRTGIDILGSFQDVEAGLYAIRQRRVSLSYDAQAFKAAYPPFATAVMTETVNVKVLEGLMKGKILTAEDLKEKGVSKESVNYRYIVEVPSA